MDTSCSYIEMIDINATPIPQSSVPKLREVEQEYLTIDDDPYAELLDCTLNIARNTACLHSLLDFHLPSLFDRLPTEMIIMIFSFLDFHDASLLEVNDGPWVLTQVCRNWREIVTHCPLFWIHANLDLSCWHYTRNRLNRADLLVMIFLERSKEIPLNVQIHCPDVQGASDHLLNAVELLLNACPRWKTAVLDLPYNVYHEISPRVNGKLALLECLTLRLDLPHKIPRNSLSVIEAFQLAPKLHQVSIEGTPYATKNIRLPWEQLTHLNAYHDYPNPNYHCLRLSSNLVECHIGAHGDLLQSPRGNYSSVSLPNLTRLFVEGTGALVLPYVFAPNTEVLHITNTSPGACSEECIEAVQEFISDCSESLKDLELHSNPLDYRVAEILYATSELVNLSLRLTLPKGSSLFEDLLKWLSYRDVPNSNSFDPSTTCLVGLLPRLTNLSMHIEPSSPDEMAFDVMALVQMLVSRRKMPRISDSQNRFSQLESFDLEVKGSLWKAESRVLDTLNEIGLRTSMRSLQ